MEARLTIVDVARAAGVSKQTVSRVLNDKGELAPETKARVLAVIRELGYRPSAAARSLLSGKTFTLGLVLPDITNPFFIDVARGVQAAAQEREYHVLLYNSSESAELEGLSVRLLHERRVDGIIICSSRLSDDRLRVLLRGVGPVVLVNRWVDGLEVTQIGSDYVHAAGLATDHLIELGHRRIAILTLAVETANSRAKLRGFLDAMERAGLAVGPDLIARSSSTIQGGSEATTWLLERQARPTAIVAYGDATAIGALHACHAQGLGVPDDVAVIGFGGSEVAGFVNPPLSTVLIPNAEMGREAVDLLLARIASRETPAVSIRREARLVVRDSTVAGARRAPSSTS